MVYHAGRETIDKPVILVSLGDILKIVGKHIVAYGRLGYHWDKKCEAANCKDACNPVLLPLVFRAFLP